MTCPTCKQEIPYSKKQKMPLLGCPRCIAQAGYESALKLERYWIERLLQGDPLVTLTKPAQATRWHLVLTNYPRAWCGEKVERWEKVRLAYPKIDTVLTPLCEACLRVFRELEDQRAEEVTP